MNKSPFLISAQNEIFAGLYFNPDFSGILEAIKNVASGNKVLVLYDYNPLQKARYFVDYLFNPLEKLQNNSFDQARASFDLLKNLSPVSIFKRSVTEPMRDFSLKSFFYNSIHKIDPTEISDFKLSKHFYLLSGFGFDYQRFLAHALNTLRRYGSFVFFNISATGDKSVFYSTDLNDNIHFNFDNDVSYKLSSELIRLKSYSLSVEKSPLKKPCTFYTPNNDKVSLYSRFDKFFIDISTKDVLKDNLPLPDSVWPFDEIKNFSTDDFNCEFDSVIENQYSYLPALINFLHDDENKVISSLKFSGSNFDFEPFDYNLISFFDSKYDLVKMMGVEVNAFKKIAYNTGSAIDSLIEKFYDIYRNFPTGNEAFAAAYEEFLKENENFLTCENN